MRLFKIALRNFLRNLARFRILVLGLSAAAAVLVFILGLSGGIDASLRQKAGRYFSGEISLLGYGEFPGSRIENLERVLQTLNELGVGGDAIVLRSVYYQQDATIYFAGRDFRQRRLIGVDWGSESRIAATMNFVEGGPPQDGDRQALLISTASAGQLGVRVGDAVTVLVGSAESGILRNSVQLQVAGIFEDPSFFGFASFMDRRTLNVLKGNSPEAADEIGLYPGLPEFRQIEWASSMLKALADIAPVYPVFTSQSARDAVLSTDRLQFGYAVLTLDANLAEIKELIDAFQLVSLFLILLFLAIVVVGVANTYGMIIFERTREIGTMRAIGLQKGRVFSLFLAEASILGTAGAFAGSLLGGVLLGVASLASFEVSGMTALFLTSGHLLPVLDLPRVLGVLAASVAAAVLGAVGAARRAAALRPVDALRHD